MYRMVKNEKNNTLNNPKNVWMGKVRMSEEVARITAAQILFWLLISSNNTCDDMLLSKRHINLLKY